MVMAPGTVIAAIRIFPSATTGTFSSFRSRIITGMTWVTAFQECGEEILGVAAKELYLLKYEEQDDLKFAEIIRTVIFHQYLFKLKVKEETFSDDQRVKSTIVKAERINPSAESRYVLGLIEKFSTEDPNVSAGVHGTFASTSGISTSIYGSVESNCNIYAATNNYSGAPTNQSAQYSNDYGGVIKQNFNRNEGQLHCNNCGGDGRSFQNCPRGINWPAQQSVGAGNANTGLNVCFKCHQPGHWASECTGAGAAAAA